MWNPLKTEIADRFASIETFFKSTRGLGKREDKISRGLAFVQSYAAYEYCVRNVVRVAVDAIVAHSHRIQDLKPPLIGLFLNPELNSFKDSTGIDSWPARTKIFESLFDARPSHNRATFPSDGTHFRQGQLKTIFRILGLKRTPAQRRRHLVRIDEVVGNRNAVAHGAESAEAVGSRYTRGEVLKIVRQVKSVCLLIISAAEKQCSDGKRHCRRK
jgi:hypothetical protein